jgi:hypothetical protein
MSIEKECKWHFMPEGPRDIGPNDPIHEKFKGRPYYSIVREAIQNSLDARLDDNKPVKVSFNWFELDRASYPRMFEIEEHINQSLKYYSNNDNAKQLLEGMLNYLNGNEKRMVNGVERNLKKFKTSCLRISDYNTIGMSYQKDKTDSPFYAFLRAGGVNAKRNSGAGGSFGFGKGAYYALSPIKTILVSTKTEDGNYFMEGSTILTTHKDNIGNKISAFGYYDNNNANPILDSNNIPVDFKREEKGTDVNIIGLWNDENRTETMIKSVLNNFWFAILDNMLIVEIDDTIISRDNIEQVIEKFFPVETEVGSSTEIENWNPKPYFRAVKYAENNEQYQVFSKSLDTLGDVKLFVYLNKGLPNRTSYFRAPKMTVYKGRRRNIINGYAAVFVCEDNTGNKILREMENPAHNEWKKENHPKEKGEISTIAKNAENELNNFVRETLKKLSKANIGDKSSVLGLEEYLFSTEELLEKYEEQSVEGDTPSTTGGSITDEITTDETGTQTTGIDSPPIKIELTKSKQQEIKEEDVTVEPDEEGEDKVTAGGENDSSGGDQEGQGDAGASTGTDYNANEGSKLFLDVNLRVAASKEQDRLYHSLIITSPRDIQNSEIELLVGADNDKDDGINLLSTDNGNVNENVLTNVQLATGRNVIKIQFSDNIKHSIKIKAYEIQ